MERPPRPAHAMPHWYAVLFAVAWCVGCASLLGTTATAALAAPPATAAAVAGADEAGLPFIRNFSPMEYGGSPQNWSVIQDQNGVVYVGNLSDGLFAFDGSRWRRIPLPNRSAVRSLAMDANGRIYVGAVGDFGYLAPDAVGQMHYVSLLDQVPSGQRQFTDVWKTLAGDDGIYFVTRTYIFRVAHGVVKTWKSGTAFHMAFLVNGTVYVREFKRGLTRLTESGPVLVTGGERFADEKIYVLLPWKGADARPNELLIGTRNDGWWLFDGKHYRRWSAEADAATKDLALYDGIWLSNGQLALAAPPSGVLVLDVTGRIVHQLTRANGLANNQVNALFEDRQRGLWVTSDLGASRISIDRPISTFDERNGLTGAVMVVGRYEGKLYAGSSDGLFELVANDSSGVRFKRLPGVKSGTWALLDSGHGLLVGTIDGLYSIDQGRLELVRSTDALPLSMLRSRGHPNRIFLGSQSGLDSIRWDGRAWRNEGPIGNFDDEIRTMVEDDQGQLWLGSWNSQVLRVTLPLADAVTGIIGAARVERFNERQGIPRGEVAVLRIDGEPRVGTSTGIMSFDQVHGRFAPDPRFAHMLAGGPRQLTLVQQDRAGKLWMFSEDINRGLRESGAAVPDAHGNWRWIPAPLQPLAGLNMLSILPEPDGTVWFSSAQGLFRYAPAHTAESGEKFSTLLRTISTKDGTRLPGATGQLAAAHVAYQKNTLRFEFAAPSFDTVDANRFQTQLTGLDNDWSVWSGEAYRDYTNLPDGAYRFQVRSHNVYGDVGKMAWFDFRVLSPWYRTWWAWLLLSTLTAIGLTLVVFWRSAALRNRNRILVALVEQRTAELQAANYALSEQTITDPLTGLKNRRYLHDHIEQDVANVNRQNRRSPTDPEHPGRNTGMAFLMVDIDHFKQVNDTRGHGAGDRVLQQMGDILRAAARDSDTPIRWGGEEFLILARFAKPGSGALLAERLRAMVAAHPFDLGNGVVLHCTCSIGFARYPFFPSAASALNWEQVVNLADECMYAAKQRGRNGWIGVQAGDVVPEDVTVALRESLERAPQAGLLTILLPPSRP